MHRACVFVWLCWEHTTKVCIGRRFFDLKTELNFELNYSIEFSQLLRSISGAQTRRATEFILVGESSISTICLSPFIGEVLLSLLLPQLQAILPSTVPSKRFCLYRSTCLFGGVAAYVGRNLATSARADSAPACFRTWVGFSPILLVKMCAKNLCLSVLYSNTL